MTARAADALAGTVVNNTGVIQARSALRAEQERVRKEFAEKFASLGDKERQDLDRQIGQRTEQKRQELLNPIMDKIMPSADRAMYRAKENGAITIFVTAR